MSTTHAITSVSLIGAGNLAWHLGRELHHLGLRIVEVYSPTAEHATALADLTGAAVAGSIEQLSAEAELYIIAVKDDAIPDIIRRFPFPDKAVVHTSGSQPLDLFPSAFTRAGVWYPLQSFRKEKPVHWMGIPVCIEARDEQMADQLESLGRLITGTTYRMSSAQRAWAHLGAVMVSNFSNALYTGADDLLREQGLSFSLLLPLILETAARLRELPPAQAQTGPARRNDEAVIRRHLDMLQGHPEWQEIYSRLTEIIRSRPAAE